jgi:hypothetical protein
MHDANTLLDMPCKKRAGISVITFSFSVLGCPCLALTLSTAFRLSGLLPQKSFRAGFTVGQWDLTVGKWDFTVGQWDFTVGKWDFTVGQWDLTVENWSSQRQLLWLLLRTTMVV